MGTSILDLLRRDLVPDQVSQFGEGDRNAWNNCLPTTELLGVASVRNRRPPDPQVETDAVYGKFYVGGEDAMAAWAWVQANVPDSAGINLVGLGTDYGAYRQAIAARRYVMGFFNCDVNATILPYPAGFFHASPIVAFDEDGSFDVLNVHDYSIQHFSYADFTKAIAFGALAFDVPIPVIQPIPIPAPEEEAMALEPVDPTPPDKDGNPTNADAILCVPGICFNGQLGAGNVKTLIHVSGQTRATIDLFAVDPETGKELVHEEDVVTGPGTLIRDTVTNPGWGLQGAFTLKVWNKGGGRVWTTVQRVPA